jgi:hypothetical protein
MAAMEAGMLFAVRVLPQWHGCLQFAVKHKPA